MKIWHKTITYKRQATRPIALYRLAVDSLVETEAFHLQLCMCYWFPFANASSPLHWRTWSTNLFSHLSPPTFFRSHQQPTSFSFVFFVTKEIQVGGDVEEGAVRFMIGMFAMLGSTVRCSLELYFQVSHYPLTQIYHPENWHARSSQGRSNGFKTPQDNQDQPFWLTACSGDASRFPSRALYFKVSCTLSLPSPSKHSGGCFLTVKPILKHLLLSLDFLT